MPFSSFVSYISVSAACAAFTDSLAVIYRSWCIVGSRFALHTACPCGCVFTYKIRRARCDSWRSWILCLSAVHSVQSTRHKSLSTGYVVTKSIFPIMQIRWMEKEKKKKDCTGITFLSFQPAERIGSGVSVEKVDKESKPRTHHVR